MREEVVIDVRQQGADKAAEELEVLARNADKASVKVDKLTGAYKAQFETTDKLSGTVRKVVVEDGKVTSATETLTKSINDNNSAVKAAEKSYSGFGRTLGQFAAAAGIVSFIKNMTTQVIASTEAIREANGQLRAYLTSQQQYAAVSAIFNASLGANATALGGMVNAFGNLRASTDLARFSSERLAAVVANASNVMRASGASAKTAVAGTLELSGALADGRISGEEFQKIMAQYPALAAQLAAGSGIGAESLKVLGLSADMAAAALARNSEEMAKKAEAAKTVSDRVGEFVTALAKYIVKLDEATGASKAINVVLEFLTKNIDTIVPLIIAMAGAWATYRAAVLAAEVATALLNGTMKGGIIGTIIKLIGLLGTAAAAWYTYNQAQDSANKQAPSGPGSNSSSSRNGVDGARAAGGPVRAGSRYLVGEEGPELFVPGTSGYIIPNGGNAGTAVNSTSGGMSPKRATTVLTEAVAEAVKQPFATITDELRLANDNLKVIQQEIAKLNTSVASGGGSAGGVGSDGVGNGMTSALNNYIAAQQAQEAVASGGGGSKSVLESASPSDGGGSTYVDPQGHIGWGKKLLKYFREEDEQSRMGVERTYEIAKKRTIAFENSIPEQYRDAAIQYAVSNRPAKMAGATIQFRSGGGFTVPGGTGTDSKLVQMRVTPGEEIDVKTRKQRREEQGMSSGGDKYINVQMHVTTPDADSFRKSEKQISRDLLAQLMKAS